MAFWDLFDDFSDALMTVSTVGSIVGAGVSAYGAFKEADATQEAAKANAQTYDQNRQYAEAQAQDAIHRGRLAASKARLATRQLIGAQRAALGANNIRLDEGSALDIQQDARQLGEADALTILENARREASGLQMEGYNAGAAAAASRAEAANTSPFLAAVPSVIGGATSVADTWLRYRR